MSTESRAVPYEPQSNAQTNRSCGAACLTMVYRSFAREASQNDIWPSVTRPNRTGSVVCATHLMVRDALSRGFAAVAIQARHPLRALRTCRDSGVRSILNHRLHPDGPAGHYSVLIDIDAENVVVHDPFYGPSRFVPHAELLDLWQPRVPNSEIVGNMLIGIAAAEDETPACPLCKTPFLPAVSCPKCKNPVGLKPAVLMGCLNDACAARIWNYVCCPSCDCTWTFTVRPPLSAGVPAGTEAGSKEDPWKLGQLFAAIDSFCAHVTDSPAVNEYPEIRRHVDFISASKQKLILAQAEDMATRRTVEQQLTAFTQAAQQREQALRKQLDELNTPLTVPDGNELGLALITRLGLTIS